MNHQNTIGRVKSDYQGFNSAFNNLPRSKMMAVRQELMTALHWSVSIFYYKKRGDTPIWEHEVPLITHVFSRFGINAWTGEQINLN